MACTASRSALHLLRHVQQTGSVHLAICSVYWPLPHPRLQVHLYTPAPGRPLQGVVRVILRDSQANLATDVFLDSDGYVSENTRAEPARGYVDVNDGGWHMVTLTTQPQVRRTLGQYPCVLCLLCSGSEARPACIPGALLGMCNQRDSSTAGTELLSCDYQSPSDRVACRPVRPTAGSWLKMPR
jgi:hypothetical protein